VLKHAAAEIPEAADDAEALRLVVARRRDKMLAYFDELAGKFGRQYVPGRSWKGLAEMILTLLPPLIIADLGAGEATLSLMLARRAKKVIAVDSSEKMVEFGTDVARKHKVRNLEYRAGDLEALPIENAAVDVAVLSQSLHHAQHPGRAVAEAWRILKPGGRLVVLDLLKHRFEEARELYADVWLGFTEVEMNRSLREAGFRDVSISVVHREAEAPHFETLMATGVKPARSGAETGDA
jgi:ArsR family transcriptional regulator